MATHNFANTTILVMALICGWGVSQTALAQSPPPDPAQLIEALKEKGPTRSASGGAQTDSAELLKRRKLIDALQNREKSRGLSAGERGSDATLSDLTISADIEDVAADRPKSDVETYFAYNSDEISAKAKPTLDALGQSLRSSELQGRTFILAGHTDAKGGGDYNRNLSERRALAVKKYLLREFQIPESELAIIGEGSEKLKVPNEPFAAENRRVEVINMGEVAMAPEVQ